MWSPMRSPSTLLLYLPVCVCVCVCAHACLLVLELCFVSASAWSSVCWFVYALSRFLCLCTWNENINCCQLMLTFKHYDSSQCSSPARQRVRRCSATKVTTFILERSGDFKSNQCQPIKAVAGTSLLQSKIVLFVGGAVKTDLSSVPEEKTAEPDQLTNQLSFSWSGNEPTSIVVRLVTVTLAHIQRQTSFNKFSFIVLCLFWS